MNNHDRSFGFRRPEVRAVALAAALLGSLSIAGGGSARAAGAEPHIEVTIDAGLRATFSLVDGDDLDECRPSPPGWFIPWYEPFNKAGSDKQRRGPTTTLRYLFRRTGSPADGELNSLATEDDPRLASAVAVGSKWACRAARRAAPPALVPGAPPAGAPPAQPPDKEVTVTKVSFSAATILSPDPIFATAYTWRGLVGPRGRALREKLGQPKECQHSAPGAADSGAAPAAAAGAVKPKPNCFVRTDDDNLIFTFDPPNPASGTVDVTFDAKGSPKLRLNVLSCTYQNAGPLSALVLGARRQTVRLSSAEPQCARMLLPNGLFGEEPSSLRFVGSGAALDAVPVTEEMAQDGIGVDVRGVPRDLKAGTYDVVQAGQKIGTIAIEVVQAIDLASKKLSVGYDDPALDAAQQRDSVESIAVVDPLGLRGLHVRNTARLLLPPALQAISQSTQASEISTPDGAVTPRNKTCPKGQQWQEASKAPDQQWAVSGLATSPMSFARADGTKAAELPGSKDILLDDASRITFGLGQSTTDGVPVLLKLYRGHKHTMVCEQPRDHRSGEKGDYLRQGQHPESPPDRTGEGGSQAGGETSTRDVDAKSPETTVVFQPVTRPILEVDLRLAESAREESLPLPIADAMKIVCHSNKKNILDNCPDDAPEDDEFDVASNGELRAIPEKSIENGQCWAMLDVERLKQHFVGRPNALQLHGPQALQIIVHRDKATDASAVWPLRVNLPANSAPQAGGAGAPQAQQQPRRQACGAPFPTSPDQCATQYPTRKIWCARQFGEVMPLPGPTGTPDEDAPYVVSIQIPVRQTAFAVYRGGNDSTLTADDKPVRPEIKFSARLHSRGTFGWKSSVRTFVTVSTELTGFRFPAAAVDLKSTKESEIVQIIQPRLGIFGVVEPWDYDKSQNPIPIRPRFMLGAHLFQFTEPVVSVSAAAGVSLTLPVFESAPTQLQSALALGFFWELDLREVGGEWDFGRSSHFVITAGVNVFSLLGSK